MMRALDESCAEMGIQPVQAFLDKVGVGEPARPFPAPELRKTRMLGNHALLGQLLPQDRHTNCAALHWTHPWHLGCTWPTNLRATCLPVCLSLPGHPAVRDNHCKTRAHARGANDGREDMLLPCAAAGVHTLACCWQ
jgi:hypothetical protein